MNHAHQHHAPTHHPPAQSHSAADRASAPGDFRLAVVATAHCLLGCGTGEVVGMLIGMQLGFSNAETITLAVILGFVFGLGLGILPLLRAGFTARAALRTVFVAEAIGIAVMEAVDVAVIVSIPGAMDAHFSQGWFWFGMAVALAAGYVAALPVNYLMIRKGYRHQH